jgi:D-sedoheptulose 7-phosphate isomerase/D-glycero-D-manno-heptose 1,7-bisphosphate phosphatase
MAFPDDRYDDIGSFADAYFSLADAAAASVDRAALRRAADILTAVHRDGGIIYSCGNGGSAAVANHLVCDHCKAAQTDTGLRPRVYSLSSNVEIMTAVSNDLSYDEVFVYQLRSMARPGDALVSISSGGDSENIVRVVSWAREHGIPVVAMTGFSGGRSARLADVNLHVDAFNYGVIEDVHQSLMHILAQYIRQAHMDPSVIKDRTF